MFSLILPLLVVYAWCVMRLMPFRCGTVCGSSTVPPPGREYSTPCPHAPHGHTTAHMYVSMLLSWYRYGAGAFAYALRAKGARELVQRVQVRYGGKRREEGHIHVPSNHDLKHQEEGEFIMTSLLSWWLELWCRRCGRSVACSRRSTGSSSTASVIRRVIHTYNQTACSFKTLRVTVLASM